MLFQGPNLWCCGAMLSASNDDTTGLRQDFITTREHRVPALALVFGATVREFAGSRPLSAALVDTVM